MSQKDGLQTRGSHSIVCDPSPSAHQPCVDRFTGQYRSLGFGGKDPSIKVSNMPLHRSNGSSFSLETYIGRCTGIDGSRCIQDIVHVGLPASLSPLCSAGLGDVHPSSLAHGSWSTGIRCPWHHIASHFQPSPGTLRSKKAARVSLTRCPGLISTWLPMTA